MFLKSVILAAIMATSVSALADIVVPMKLVGTQENGKSIGLITLSQIESGVLIKPALRSLSPGMHGFHLHVNPTCDHEGMDAGGHYDPQKTNAHLGPYDKHGHLGDLPALYVDQAGIANTPVLAPRLKLDDFKGHALMIHQGGDNYSDTPSPLGGGGARIACGVIDK